MIAKACRFRREMMLAYSVHQQERYLVLQRREVGLGVGVWNTGCGKVVGGGGEMGRPVLHPQQAGLVV